MYQWINWVDETDEYEDRYQETDNGDGTITHTKVRGTVYVEGTPQDAAHFNKMDAGIVDAHVAEQLQLLAHRQVEWRVEDLETATAQEVGTVTLTNSAQYPFNNSQQSVALARTRENVNYIVEILKIEPTGGPAGEITISDRLVNGFKAAFDGSASSVKLTYAVIGGYN